VTFGMSLPQLVAVHTAMSVIGLVTGVFVLAAMLAARKPSGLTGLFLVSTTLASVTAFMFPSKQIGLGHAVGVLSLIVLAPTLFAIAARPLTGGWRVVYAAGATAALYLNVVIGVLQLFAKQPALRPDGPLLTAPTFLAAQLVVLLAFVALGALVVRRFHPPARPDMVTVPRGPALTVR